MKAFAAVIASCLAALWVSLAGGQGAEREEDPGLGTITVVLHVAEGAFFDLLGGLDSKEKPEAQMERLVAPVHKVFAEAGLRFHIEHPRKLEIESPGLAGREDRNRLARLAPRVPGCIEVFIVASAGDVDREDEEVAGVHWRYLGPSKENRGRRYIILSGGAARPDTLAHELGHWFGLGHVRDTANLMCAGGKREGQGLDAAQRARIREACRKAFASGELKPHNPLDRPK